MLLKLSLVAVLLPACLASFRDDQNHYLETQERLYRDLFHHYNKFIIPQHDFDTPLNLTAGLLVSTMDFDDQGVLKMVVWLATTWTDERLTWEPEDYHGIEKIEIPAEMIWIHDLEVHNAVKLDYGSFSDNMQFTEKKHMVQIKYDGTVGYWPMSHVSVRLTDEEYKDWPWGEYSARLKLGSWVYTTTKMAIHTRNDFDYIQFPRMKEMSSPCAFTKKSFLENPLRTDSYPEGDYHSLNFNFYVQKKFRFTEQGMEKNPNDIKYHRQ